MAKSNLTLNDYQDGCAVTVKYPDSDTGNQNALNYTVLGLAGEAGEVADKWKKVLRGDFGTPGEMTPEIRDLMIKEVGDVLWYAARIATELGVSLADVAQGNLDKLASRLERGVVKGSGDER